MIFPIILVFLIFLESSVTTFPLVFIALILYAVLHKNPKVIPIAFIAGFFLDLLSFSTIGLSSLFFVSFIFIFLLYDHKFEISSTYSIAIFSFIGTIIFELLMGHLDHPIFISLLSAIVAALLFKLLISLNSREVKW